MSETIYAPSTLIGRSGVTVVRISGPDTHAALSALLGIAPMPAPRRASLRPLLSPEDGSPLDRAVVLWLPGPASFTGEDMAELHLHGGRAVAQAVLGALARLPGLRLAEPGEFARRAFDAGRLDLTEVEAIADLVSAETEAQRRQALRQMEGALGALVEGWRERLIGALAQVEAVLDFPEEGLPDALEREIARGIGALQTEIGRELDDRRRGERLRAGYSVAILGAPNVGKSSLLNWLARRDAAIVSTVAGTTRDVIEVDLDLGGYPVAVADTAGLRDSDDPVESEGIRRARARAAAADLKLVLFEASARPDPVSLALLDDRAVPIATKIDLAPSGPHPSIPSGALEVSVATGVGLDRLLQLLEEKVRDSLAPAAGAPALTRARHRQALEEARAELAEATRQNELELRAENLRLATRALGRVTGRIEVEEVLDRLFREFCIGK
ncbi:MAG: trmE [Rhodospirillales bacterium]|jgi:tRNA modification GTPase|nr:trmE [Rhodospirillales bacterium]